MAALAGRRSTAILSALLAGFGAIAGAAGQLLVGLRKIILAASSSRLRPSISSAWAGGQRRVREATGLASALSESDIRAH